MIVEGGGRVKRESGRAGRRDRDPGEQQRAGDCRDTGLAVDWGNYS